MYVAQGPYRHWHNEEGSRVKGCQSGRLLVLTSQARPHVRAKVRSYCCYIMKAKTWEEKKKGSGTKFVLMQT